MNLLPNQNSQQNNHFNQIAELVLNNLKNNPSLMSDLSKKGKKNF